MPTPAEPGPANPARVLAGPLLHFRGVEGARLRLAAVAIVDGAGAPPEVEAEGERVEPRTLGEIGARRVLRYDFALNAQAGASYAFDGRAFAVAADWSGDVRLAYVSCNGCEEGDLERDPVERNAMWSRLGAENAARPFHLLLQGGDQIYADEVVEAHPLVAAWSRGERASAQAPAAEVSEAREALREAYLARYAALLGQPQIAAAMATIPGLAMWDDHDICDGWGSLRPWMLDAPVGRALFEAAREAFLLVQRGRAPGETGADDLDEAGESLGWTVSLPGLTVVAPDLRSERRPDRVMGPAGWRGFEAAMAAADAGRVLVMSSTPALGPRLSWVEAAMSLTRRMEKYEDDLRDQWQSRAHRAEWRRFLETMMRVHADAATPVTVLSGEIHLATRAELDAEPAPLAQLVSSGVTHPEPPRLYARMLGALARLGEGPVPGRRIRIRPLPGRRAIYAEERNYLTLERNGGAWSAAWELERSGRTPDLAL